VILKTGLGVRQGHVSFRTLSMSKNVNDVNSEVINVVVMIFYRASERDIYTESLLFLGLYCYLYTVIRVTFSSYG